MNCIIIEDQPPAQRILKKYVEDIGTLELGGVFPDALHAMDYLKTHSTDLIFLDIHLPRISGLDFLKTMPNLPAVILTTAYPDYALESYEFNVVDYLLKPFSFQRFVKAVSKVPVKSPVSQIVSNPEVPARRSEFFVKSGYDHIRIDADDILYIKSDADYSEIIVANRKILSSEPLRRWIDLLDNNQFIRVHKSFIVNTLKIVKISGNEMHMTNGEKVPIGRAYKDDFNQRIIG